jgi:hypothetical protein
MTESTLDEALERLRGTGPERDGWLSNHAPMAAEALARNGHAGEIDAWLDGYRDRLEDAPRGISPISREAWRDPLGDPVRTGDWIAFFEREVHEAPWREVLATWWPRLLPGIAAGATHGVIRVGHAVRALLDAETGPGSASSGRAWPTGRPAGSRSRRPVAGRTGPPIPARRSTRSPAYRISASASATGSPSSPI